MSVQFNHTIWHVKDSRASAQWLAELFDLPPPKPFGPFMTVMTHNDVSLDFIDAGDYPFQPQHYAFLVGEDDFDRILAHIRERHDLLGRSSSRAGRKYQSPFSWAWRVLRGSGWPSARDHHAAVRLGKL